jgi:hypothetical protein
LSPEQTTYTVKPRNYSKSFLVYSVSRQRCLTNSNITSFFFGGGGRGSYDYMSLDKTTVHNITICVLFQITIFMQETGFTMASTCCPSMAATMEQCRKTEILSFTESRQIQFFGSSTLKVE